MDSGYRTYLINKNKVAAKKQYEFYLNNVKLEYAPSGWDEDEFTTKRDMKRWGVFRQFTNSEMKFVKDGRDALITAEKIDGVNTKTEFKVIENTPSGRTRNRFVGQTDYSTKKETEISCDVQVIDGSFTDLVLTRASTKVNILGTKSMDGDTITPHTMTDLTVPQIIITQNAAWDGTNYDEVVSNNNGFIIQLELNFSEFNEAQLTEDYISPFFKIAETDYDNCKFTYAAIGSVQAETHTPDGFFVNVTIYKIDKDGISTIIGTDLYSSDPGDSVTINTNLNAWGSVKTGDRVFYSLSITCSDSGIIFDSQITYAKLEMQSTSGTIEEHKIKVIHYHEAIDNILMNYTGLAGRIKSNAIGRIDIGYSSDGELGVYTNGRFIKNTLGLNDTLALSLDDVFNMLNSVFCFGMGVEVIGGNDTLVIEPISHFFTNKIILDISNRLAPETIEKEYYPELAFNRVSVGYNSFDYGRIGGIYEYNTTSKFTTPIKPVDAELGIISNIRGDLSGLVTLLNTESNSKDTQYENDVFVIDAVKSGTDYIAHTNEGFAQVADVSRRDVLLNIRISPKRNLLRWGAYLRGFADKYLTKSFIWQTSDKNTRLSSTETGQSTISENSDILISDFDDPIWINETFTVEVPQKETDIDIINSTPYGIVKLTSSEYGYLLEYKAKNENRKSEFKLLRVNTDYVTPLWPSKVTIIKQITNVGDPDYWFSIHLLNETTGQVFEYDFSVNYPYVIYDLPNGHYLVTEIYDENYETRSITPSSFTIDNINREFEVVVENAKLTHLDLTFNDIAHTLVTDPHDVRQWNTHFGLPTYGNVFTSVIVDGNTVKLYGGGNMTIGGYQFSSSNLLKVEDLSGIIIHGGGYPFNSCTNLEEIICHGIIDIGYQWGYNLPKLTKLELPNLTHITSSDAMNKQPLMKSYIFPELLNFGTSGTMNGDRPLEELYIPKMVNLGPGTINNFEFINYLGVGIKGHTIHLTVPAALMTCNGGDPDGDIVALQTNNTVTITTV